MKEKLQDFYSELEQLFQKQLDANPDLFDVRMKLAELYYEQHRTEDFIRNARAWRARSGRPGADREWARVASMGRMLVGADPLFAAKDGDKIEFVGEGMPAPTKEASKIRRFGDEERYHALFARLAEAYEPVRRDPRFVAEHELALVSLAARRPTPLVHARNLSDRNGGAQVYIKREDLSGDAPHLTVALTGQALFARKLGRKTLVIGTGDGRRAAISASIAARLGLKLVVFMDAEVAQRQTANALFTRLMGADLRMVKATAYRNKDVREAALEHWHQNPETSFLLTGLDAAPPPYPVMTQEFVAAIGREARRQFTSLVRKAPDLVATRGAQAADAIGFFPAFFADDAVKLACIEGDAGPELRQDDYRKTGQPLTSGERKVAKNILDKLEYPSVSREHALLRSSGRVQYVKSDRRAARAALLEVARCEGLILAIDTAHVLAWTLNAARTMRSDQAVLVIMTETADKDAWDISQLVGDA